jgi:hypothetical protein
MFSFSSVQDVIIFHGVNFIFFEGLDVIISSVGDVILFHDVNVIIFEGLDVIIFHGVPYIFSFLKHWVLSILGVVSLLGCYHLCYHLVLSFDVIIF